MRIPDPLYLLLACLLIVSAGTDFKYKKIFNAVTFPAMIIGIIVHGFKGGVSGVIYSIEGLFLGLALLVVFYVVGMMGAGDVKLMGAVGSILGPVGVFNAFLFTAIVGGIYALIVLAYHGQLLDFLKRMALSLKVSLLNRGPTLLPSENKESLVLCYGIAIAIGTLLSMVL
jgi:prepilin peptidase CpaA